MKKKNFILIALTAIVLICLFVFRPKHIPLSSIETQEISIENSAREQVKLEKTAKQELYNIVSELCVVRDFSLADMRFLNDEATDLLFIATESGKQFRIYVFPDGDTLNYQKPYAYVQIDSKYFIIVNSEQLIEFIKLQK